MFIDRFRKRADVFSMDTTVILRWTARILSLEMLAGFVAFLFGAGLSPILDFTTVTLAAALVALNLAGLIFAWRNEPLGAIIALAGALGVYVKECVPGQFRQFPGSWEAALLIVAPLLFLGAWWSGSRNSAAQLEAAGPEHKILFHWPFHHAENADRKAA